MAWDTGKVLKAYRQFHPHQLKLQTHHPMTNHQQLGSSTEGSNDPFLEDKRDWTTLRRVVRWVLSVGGLSFMGLIGYAASSYVHNVSTEAAANTLTLVSPLIVKVQSLEEYRERAERQSEASQLQMTDVLLKLSALQTLQDDNNKNTERILRKLDSIK